MSEEHRWIEGIISGDEQALKCLYDAYSSKVYSTILNFTKNAEDAEELMQDVFIGLINAAKNFRQDATVSTWMYRMAVNKSLDFLRKKNSQKRMGVFTSIYKRNTGEVEHESVDFVHPGVKMEHADDARLLFLAMEGLSNNQKTAFVLTQVEGLPQKKVAEIMDVSRKSVESLLQRAKANLREELEKFYPERGKRK